MNSDVRFFYLRDRNGFPRVCVARVIRENLIVFGYSVHNPKDKYSRHLAREIASNRLFFELSAPLTGDHRITGGIIELKQHENPAVSIAEALAGEVELENCARQDLPAHSLVSSLARRWLRENDRLATLHARIESRPIPANWDDNDW